MVAETRVRRSPEFEAAQESYIDLLTQQVGRAPGTPGIPTLAQLGPQVAGVDPLTQAAQQRANIMAGLRGAAGTSGIAGLAQALANQGVIQARQVSADIARQEAAGQLAMAKGAMAVDQLERQGQAAVQQAESAREATILGMEYGALTGANQAQQQASQNQMYQGIAGMQMQQQNMLALASLSGVDGPLSNLFGDMGGNTGSSGINFTYDSSRDAFIPPKYFNSWTLDETKCVYVAPVTYPTIKTYNDENGDEQKYSIYWDEDNLRWLGDKTISDNYYWNPSNLSWISYTP